MKYDGKFFHVNQLGVVSDKEYGMKHSKFARLHVKTARYDEGFYIYRTNAQGLREENVIREKAENEYRILVLGDSHVDGNCKVNDTFPNVSESILNRQHDDSPYNVINSGTLSWSIQQMYLFLKENSDIIKPDMALLTFYTGNDLVDLIGFHDHYPSVEVIDGKAIILPAKRRAFPWLVEHSNLVAMIYFRLVPKNTFSSNPMLGQDIGQVRWLRTLEQARWFDKYAAVLDDLISLCRQKNILLKVLILPTMMQVQGANQDYISFCKSVPDLEPQDLKIDDLIVAEFIKVLQHKQIDFLNFVPVLRSSYESTGEDLYDPVDYHLNLAGQHKVGEILAKEILAEPINADKN